LIIYKIYKMETEMLQKISNYAKKIDKSVTWVYKLAKAGKIEIVEIDGVKFVKEKEKD